MRHLTRLRALLPAIASLVACGGAVSATDQQNVSGAGGTTGGPSSGGGGTTSAGGGGGGGSGGGAAFDVDLCGGGTEHAMLEGVTPAPRAGGVDYLELRDQYTYEGSTPPFTVVAKHGTPCASAADRPACEASLAATRASGWNVESIGMEMPRTRYLVATSGDTIEVIKTIEALAQFVAPIDTPKDAALLVVATGKYRIVCDGSKHARATASGFDIRAQTGHTCGAGMKLEEHVLAVTSGGAASVVQTKVLEEGEPNCAIGRRPAGLVARRAARDVRRDGEAAAPLGSFCADAAYLEAASVVSFERLAKELDALGAPPDLVQAARDAADDEVRHARAMTKLARRFGASVGDPEVAACAPRTAFEIARENAVEGCVRETYGALVAHWQATAAGDRELARVMRVIAEDETRHAALAWDVASFFASILDAEELAAIEAARGEAIAALRRELAAEPGAALVAAAGMPPARDAVALLDTLDATLLRAAA